MLAILVQTYPHADDLFHDRYAPGGAWESRVKAILDVSRVAVRGGPFLAVPAGSSFEPVDLKVNDLGYAALGFAWGRMFGRPLNRRRLMGINLALLLMALGSVLALTPPSARLAAVVVLLLVPIPVPAYRSPDPLATHGSLLLFGVVIAVSVSRRWPVWAHVLLGAALFAIHAIRSAYAFYGAAALVAVAVIHSLRTRERAPLSRGLVVLGTALALNLAWQVPLARRASDPRIAQQDALGTHPVYIPLLEGVGWTENRWGIKPWDPWVATYLGQRFQLEPVDVGTRESERRAALTYRALWLEAPLHLIGVYASRVPRAVGEHAFGGIAGGVGLIVVLPIALLVTWRRPDPLLFALLVATAALSACLAFQTIVLDPRLLYAYPLRLASALTLAFSTSVLVDLVWRRRQRSSQAREPNQ